MIDVCTGVIEQASCLVVCKLSTSGLQNLLNVSRKNVADEPRIFYCYYDLSPRLTLVVRIGQAANKLLNMFACDI